MCLAIPMEVLKIEGAQALCAARGVERTVGLALLAHENVRPGDHVMVHIGFAISKVTPEDAAQTWEVIDQVNAVDEALGLTDA